jgi:hypothetical protein
LSISAAQTTYGLGRQQEKIMGPLEVMLFAGLTIPQGWADGFKHSAESKAKCESLMAALPAYARGQSKCIVKVDPNASTPKK